jgi:small ligand-binding sensory domain FIST
MSEEPTTANGARGAVAVSGHLDTRTAGTEVASDLYDAIGAGSDLVIVFASFHHRAALPEAVQTIRQTLDPGVTMAVTTEGVLGGAEDLEGVAGMSALALRLPGVTLNPWMSTPDDPISLSHADQIRERISLTDEFRTAIMIAEPFTTPITRLLPALTGCGGRNRPVPIIGGMASGASQPGHNVLILDDRVVPAGSIGVSISGGVTVDCVVSQGCRPIGDLHEVTKAKGNMILEVDQEPALAALQQLASSLSEQERELIQKGVLIGNVVSDGKTHYGRGDFLVRNLLGIDQERGAILVADMPAPGQKIQFHVRDAVTAAEDLQLLLDAQQLREPPYAGLLFTCNGRGKRLFGEPNHDIGVILERLGSLPIAGFFAAGEIGPLGEKSFLHGHTAALALFRPPAGE